MKFIPLYVSIAVLLFQEPLKATERDTLTVHEYLGQFKQEFELTYDLTWMGKVDSVSLKKYYAFMKIVSTMSELWGKKIKLDNGTIVAPQIMGQAYSYRKINDHTYWLIVYKGEGESGISFSLRVLDTDSGSVSKSYILTGAGGDEGYWGKREGHFINDSVYQYTYY